MAKNPGKAAPEPRPSRPAAEDAGQTPAEPAAAERSQVDESVWQNTEMWQRTFDAVPDLIAVLDTQHRMVRVNQAMADRLGLTKEQCVGQTCYTCVHATDEPPSFCPHSQLLQDGKEHTVEVREEALGGDFLVSVCPLRDSAGNLVGSVHIARDITEQRQSESERAIVIEVLRLVSARNDRHELLRSVTALLQEWSGCEAVGIRLREGEDFPYFETRGFPPEFVLVENSLCEVDAQGELLRDSAGNPVLECICGNVIRGRFDPAKPFFTPRGSFWTNSTSALLASTTEADRQARTRNRCNGEGYESVALIRLRAAGETFGLLQLNDRRQDRFTPRGIALFERLADSVALALAHRGAEEALCESAERLERAMRAGNVGLWEWDLRTNHVFHSPHWKRPFASQDQVIDDDIAEWQSRLHPDDRDGCLQTLRAFVEKPRPDLHFEFRFRGDDGSYRWFLGQASLVLDDQGKAVRMLGSYIDVTERKRAEETLRESQRQQAEAEKLAATGRMAALVAHEINNPLAGIKNSFRLIRDAVPKDHPNRDMVQRIEREIDRIARIVRQMYQIYSPRVEQLDDIPVGPIVLNVLELLEPLCRQKEVTVEVETIAPELTVRACEGSLQQILFNLVANAIEASPPAAVVHVAAAPADQDYARISIRDRGPGIPDEVRAHMFEPFVSADVGSAPKHGLGLGLAIVKNIVESLKGRIAVESAFGEGTCFRVDLPSKQS